MVTKHIVGAQQMLKESEYHGFYLGNQELNTPEALL